MCHIIGIAGAKKRYLWAVADDTTVWCVLLGCQDSCLDMRCQVIAWYGGKALLGAGNGEQIFDDGGHVASVIVVLFLTMLRIITAVTTKTAPTVDA